MRVLLYNELEPDRIPNFHKIVRLLEASDFRSAELKKVGDNLYRARLDRSNRLLLSFYRHRDETCILVLEFIPKHAYERSRFLRGEAVVDEDKIPTVTDVGAVEKLDLTYLNPRLPRFHLLDKILSFDDAQQAVYTLPPPLIVIGSAGSGKTALTLEKMKQAPGDVLYVTRSPYLVHNARSLYYAHGYENEAQNVDFLSFQEYLESVRVPPGRELTFREFADWLGRQRLSKTLRDAHQLFEEFKGVLTGSVVDRPYLSREDYLGLGIKQSIFLAEDREAAYDLFVKYLQLLADKGCFDANILSYEYLARVEPCYDFIVVDEVQDLTNVQLQVILRALHSPREFILCGDSNQIVHPNFFSWAKVKSFFYRQEEAGAPAELIRILDNNYRNSPEVTELANRILKLKHARFGSVDRESNYLVHSSAQAAGRVALLPAEPAVTRELNNRTRSSSRFAVIVMRPEQKVGAREYFDTPLIFSIQEAKGLEYDNVVLFNFISPDTERFREISRGVMPEDMAATELPYARSRDKADKSLEVHKFYINALYVAATRSVKNLYLLEQDPRQHLFDLLGLEPLQGPLDLERQQSSLEEWRVEARKLELQGKQEQAEAIRRDILKQKAVPWEALSGDALARLEQQAITQGDKKAKLLLFEYALVYHDQRRLNALLTAGFAPARTPSKGIKTLNQKYFLPYEQKQPVAALRLVDQYGVDFRDRFNQTPLMVASRMGNAALAERLMGMGADPELVNNVGFNAFRIALEQACANPKYAAQKLPAIYPLLMPDSMTVQVSGRLVKLDSHQMEFLMLNLMMALSYVRLGIKVARRGGAFESADFVEVLAHFPDRVVPERRKQRGYISSILAKNEVSREDRYNRRLFYRWRRGHYILNPGLGVRVEGEWRNIYDLLSLDLIDHGLEEGFAADFVNEYNQQRLTEFRRQVMELRKR